MDTIIYYICVPFGYLMKACWTLVSDYGVAILLFTLATKLLLMPISIWIQNNSIVMVRLQPEINFLKVKFYGDKDAILDGQAALFKQEKYHPMLSLVPLVLQILLLLAVVEIIYNPLTYLFGLSNETAAALGAAVPGVDMSSSSWQLAVVQGIQQNTFTVAAIPGLEAGLLERVVEEIATFDLSFLGFNLGTVPSQALGIYFLVPVAAAFSAWLMAFTQNLSNVIQHEQGKLSQYGLMGLSVLLSLYLGFFVPAGIGLYWTASNLFSIGVMYLLNLLINPKKFVDYAALEESRKQLSEIEVLDGGKKERPKEEIEREKEDYKRFFGTVNKKIVFYSEKSGFYKYYQGLIEALLKRSNLVIHYVTNDPDDAIFKLAEKEPRIRPYYIGLKKLIPLMLKLECDMMVMTTPDLNKYYLKRSLMKKDIEYVYLPHDMMSVHMGFREGALDAFDTIFCTGPHVAREVRATEALHELPAKTLVQFGFPYADILEQAGSKEREERAKESPGAVREILIAPSWQEDNLLDSCLDELIEGLWSERYHITVRPHPEYAKRYAAKLQKIVDKYADKVGDRLTFELDFSLNRSTYASDLLITDWSGIAYEYCVATKRPAIFINTKIKCLNPNWEKLKLEPAEIALRRKVGVALEKSELDSVGVVADELINEADAWPDRIEEVMDGLLYCRKNGGEAGASYILCDLLQKQKSRCPSPARASGAGQ